MATAKRKQEQLGGAADDDDCSEPMDSDSESIDLESHSNGGRKRCRMDDDMRQQLMQHTMTVHPLLEGVRHRFAQNN